MEGLRGDHWMTAGWLPGIYLIQCWHIGYMFLRDIIRRAFQSFIFYSAAVHRVTRLLSRSCLHILLYRLDFPSAARRGIFSRFTCFAPWIRAKTGVILAGRAKFTHRADAALPMRSWLVMVLCWELYAWNCGCDRGASVRSRLRAKIRMAGYS